MEATDTEETRQAADDMSVREWFRRCLSAQAPEAPAGDEVQRVGELELAGFQRRAAARGLQIARAYGGVLLADAVGLGKTRVALAIGRALARDRRLSAGRDRPVWCCTPARLREQWKTAATRAGLEDCQFVTHTDLSRGKLPDPAEPSVVIVDEAHRFRNPRAKRSQALAALAERAPLVLATATPVCNAREDLYHLLSLFLAEYDLRGAVGCHLREAFNMAEDGRFDLSEVVEQVVIRRIEAPSRAGFGRRPDVALEILDYQADGAERWLWQNLEGALAGMTMELFRADWPRGLLLEYVLKRWESGADALLATLAQMTSFHRRWLEADDHGRSLSRESFRRLFDGDLERAQGVFPFVFDTPGNEASRERDEQTRVERRGLVERDLERLSELEERARQVAASGGGKRAAILDLAKRDGAKLLIFTGYQHAAQGLYEHLADGLGARARVGLVTGAGARATGLGRSRPEEVIRRFAPQSNGAKRLAAHQQLDVLVSTDCLSEGVNLQDCGDVVLADLPYSPLGVEQRIGRLVRPGGPHEQVTVYLPRPRSWTDSLGMRRRLDDKLGQAADAGAAFATAGQLADGGQATKAVGDGEMMGPLAALTRLDHLISVLEADTAEPIEAGFWRAAARHGPPRLWARVAVHEESATRWLWCLVRDGAPAQMRLHGLLDELIRDSDLTGALEACEPSGALWEEAERAVEQREKLLRAARLAPFPLRLDAPQRALWAKIGAAVEGGALSLEADALGELRHELLRSFPRGAERRLGELAAGDMSPRRLLAQVRRIVGHVPRWSPQVRLEIVAGLEVC
ncbi:MAG: SNF2-related protein [Persicimonas sp.]